MRTLPPSVPPLLPERRDGPRVPLSIWVEEHAGPGVLFRRSGNLSLGGIYLEVAVPQDVGTLVDLEFQLPDDAGEAVRVHGIVVSADADRAGMGIRFVDLPSDIQARIVRCIGNKLETSPDQQKPPIDP